MAGYLFEKTTKQLLLLIVISEVRKLNREYPGLIYS
jgi:hypothetical protein